MKPTEQDTHGNAQRPGRQRFWLILSAGTALGATAVCIAARGQVNQVGPADPQEQPGNAALQLVADAGSASPGSAAANAGRSTRVPVGAPRNEASVTVEQVEYLPGKQPAQLLVTESEATLRGRDENKSTLGVATAGARFGLKLADARAGRDNVIIVTVPFAARSRVTLRLGGQSATEDAEGAQVTFFLRNRAGGPRLMGASQLYQRDLNEARKAAIPGARRPQKIMVADYVVGPGPSSAALDAALQTMGLLGMNTLQLEGFGRLAPEVAPRARKQGITRFSWATYAPPQYFAWSDAAQQPAAWASGLAKKAADNGLPASSVGLFKLAEEPTWYFPSVLNLLWNKPSTLERYRNYLREQGLTPQALGANSWDEVSPVRRSNSNSLPLRRRYYWTLRFYGDGAARGFGTWGNALRQQFGNGVIPTSNALPNGSRPYWVGPKGEGSDADAGMQWPFWMDIGRYAAPFGLWTEDWTGDEDAATWSYHADILRCAARLGQGNIFGGNLVARRLGSLGEAGGRYRALALLGHGGKGILWYNYGPEPFFGEYSWSDNTAAYPAIASANALIGEAEDLLYPGRRGDAEIALLLPRSAYYWGPRDPNPGYATDLQGLYSALSHSQYPVDFVDEEGVAGGELARRQYRVLYVTAPNLSAASARAIKTWVQNGGTVVFSGAPAGGADEYDEPTNIFDDLRGVRAMPRGKDPAAAGVAAGRNVVLTGAEWGVQNPPGGVRFAANLPVTTARVVGRFQDGGTAVTVNSFGRGKAISYGFRPGNAYWNSAQRGGRALPRGWKGDWRGIANAAVRQAGISRPVEVDVPLVEAARLDSESGIAVTLLNWTGQPVPRANLVVRDAAGINRAQLASGANVPFTRRGQDLVSSVPVRDADVLLLRR